MTPAERARQIDQEEFDTECKAARERALAHSKQCRKDEGRKLKAWLTGKEPPATKLSLMRIGREPVKHTVNGQTRTMKGWAQHLGITAKALITRRRKLGSLAAAIAFEPAGRWAKHPTPGVASDFARSEGTGGGSTAQETPKITFSKKA